MKILIVDDQTTNLKLLRAQLEAEGHAVIEAADGVDALAALELQGADAIISDILMPRMDGFAFCRAVRERPQFARVPLIIYTSTYNSPSDEKTAYLVGADKYLLKPAPASTIHAVLREVTGANPPRRNPEVPSETVVMREYNAALVRKLEEKNDELAATIGDLKNAEARYRGLFENSVAGLYQASVEGRMVSANVALARLFGFATAEEFLSRHGVDWPERHAPERRGEFARELQARGAVSDFEYELRRADGSVRWISENARMVSDGAGRPVSLQGSLSDITDRKEAERNIRRQTRLLDLAHDSISERDLEDRFLYWNQGSERLYGWRAEEIVGRKVGETLRPNPDEFMKAKVGVLRTGEWSGELRHSRRDGHLVTVSSRWTLVRDDRGNPKSILVINTDISEKKTLEAQFFRAQRMEAIGTLASGMAHDLNNILAPILMSAPILRWTLPPSERDKILQTIETSAKRGADLVRQLLTFGRGASGERGMVRMDKLVHEIVGIGQQTFPKNITVVGEVAEDLWTLRGDPTQLHQVLLNLCVNARDAMPQGGTLTIEGRNERVDESFASMVADAKPGNYVVLRVRDTGTGIPAEIADKIFDPFFTTKEEGKGTGLGLATVAGIVKGHGGFLMLRSEVGRGTVFSIYFPATDAAADGASPATKASAIPRAQGELVLVVDDEENIRNIVRETLVRHGYQALTATDGADAVATYARMGMKIHAVLTDIDMPVMDGVTMIQVLKRLNPQLRVLVSSGLASSGRVERRKQELRALGVESILPKPYTADKILAAMHALLTR